MTSTIETAYRRYLLPKRLIFFDLDGTIIPSTNATGRRIAIAIHCYDVLRQLAEKHLNIGELPDLDNEQCSQWHRDHGGPLGLIMHVLADMDMADDVKKCLGFYYLGLFNERLEQYHPDDLEYDSVPDSYLDFLQSLANKATLILVSYRYQQQRGFLDSIAKVGLTKNGLFGIHNAFAVGGPSSSSDGSKARFVGKMWRREIRAQRRLTSETGKTFPPFMIGDSIRDLHFAADSGGIFFGVAETGVHSKDVLLNELKQLDTDINSLSRVFPSVGDTGLQNILHTECDDYLDAIADLAEEN